MPIIRPMHSSSPVLRIALSLLAGAVLLLSLLTGYFLTGDRYRQLTRLNVQGAELEVLQGNAAVRGDALMLRPPEALLRLPIPVHLSADRYTAFSVRLTDGTADAALFLVWVPEAARRQIVLPLEPAAEGGYTLALDSAADWSGEIEVSALAVRATTPVGIAYARLDTDTPGITEFQRRLFADWIAFEGWWGHSINRIHGGDRAALLGPVPAAALWLLLSALVYTGWTRMIRQPLTPTPLLTLFLIGWIALDLRWQIDLTRQLSMTRETYASQSRDEQRLAAPDGALFAFIRTLKANLPDTPARVFVVAEDDDGYLALRAKYHLLPHNADNRYPGRQHLRPGDVIVLLDGAPQLRHGRMPASGDTPGLVDVLIDAENSPIPVRPLLRMPAGQAFEVL